MVNFVWSWWRVSSLRWCGGGDFEAWVKMKSQKTSLSRLSCTHMWIDNPRQIFPKENNPVTSNVLLRSNQPQQRINWSWTWSWKRCPCLRNDDLFNNLLFFQSQGHLTGWVVEDELLEKADKERFQQFSRSRYQNFFNVINPKPRHFSDIFVSWRCFTI